MVVDSGSPRPLLLADRGCPFAHRVLALLDQVGVAHDACVARCGELPQELARYSPSGRIPLLVHGAVVIGESRVMLEHLAEAYGFDAAYPAALDARTRHRHAMAFMDGFLAPRLASGDPTGEGARLDECLDAIEDAALATEPAPCLLAFHLAPMWLRFQWWRPDGAVTRAIAGRPRLAAWLDGAASLRPIVRTAPDRADNIADFHSVCALLARPSR